MYTIKHTCCGCLGRCALAIAKVPPGLVGRNALAARSNRRLDPEPRDTNRGFLDNTSGDAHDGMQCDRGPHVPPEVGRLLSQINDTSHSP